MIQRLDMNPTAQAPQPKVRAAAGKGLIVFCGLLVPLAIYFLLAHALPKLTVTPAIYGEHYWHRKSWLLAHIIFGLTATLLGPSQFIAAIRSAFPVVHRTFGNLYMCAVLIAAFTALILATTSDVTVIYAAGLCVVATLWVTTAAFGYTNARMRKFSVHRRWMIRNYTITFFFPTFFVVHDLLMRADTGMPDDVATVLAWASWIVPLLLVESLLSPGRNAQTAV